MLIFVILFIIIDIEKNLPCDIIKSGEKDEKVCLRDADAVRSDVRVYKIR